jgi:hypothetical protein
VPLLALLQLVDKLLQLLLMPLHLRLLLLLLQVLLLFHPVRPPLLQRRLRSTVGSSMRIDSIQQGEATTHEARLTGSLSQKSGSTRVLLDAAS